MTPATACTSATRPLHPYMVHDGEPSEGAVLVLAHTAKDARRIGYPAVSGWVGASWTDIRANRLRQHIEYFVSCGDGKPQCIDDMPTCASCGFWTGGRIYPNGYCHSCGGRE